MTWTEAEACEQDYRDRVTIEAWLRCRSCAEEFVGEERQ